MCPQFKKINNESGIVLFIVLMTAIIIMIFSVGILTQSMNEINYAQQQIDQIASEQCAKGAFWKAYATGMTVPPGSGDCQPLSGRSYTVSVPASSTAGAIKSYTVQANYDTF